MSEELNFQMTPYLKTFNKMYKQFNDIYREAALHFGISNTVFDILYVICELGSGCQQKDICEATYIPKQTVNSAIRNLQQDGMIRLEPGKGRGMKIYLTKKGAEWTKEIMEPVINMEKKSFEILGEDTTEQLLELYGRYIAILNEQMKLLGGKNEI